MPAQLTRCCTQAGEVVAPGWMTCDGSPTTIDGCACKRPSKIQMRPNPIRSSIRHDGSGSRLSARPPPGPAGRHSRTLTQASASTPKTSNATIP